MNSSQRVFINTMSQYIRTGIVMLLTLYIVRVVLASLGQSDYGVYTVVAGCVAMLGFLTNSLVRTTQRFISFYQGKKDIGLLKKVFNNCLVVHIILGLVIVGLLETLSPFFFNGFLNIPSDRITSAFTVYHLVVLMLLVTIQTSPYRALLISHENIVYISVIDVLDVLLKLVLVIIMSNSSTDRLNFYGCIMAGVQIFNFAALSFYCYHKYDECVLPRIKGLQKSFVIDMGKFAGWQIYGTACQIGRDQGLSIVLNRAFGTVINAGMGIGLQIYGATNTLSSAITNAMAPQIVKAEGAGERNRTIWLSNVLSKMVFFLVSILGVPVLFELPEILKVWLGDYPESAVFFGRMYIIALMADSLTIGLTHINNAIGNIGKYIIIMNTPKLASLLIIIIMLYLDYNLYYVGGVYILVEFFCSIIRVPLIKEQAGLSIKDFCTSVVLLEMFPLIINLLFCWFATSFIVIPYRFIITFLLSSIIYGSSMYVLGFTNREKNVINGLVCGIKRKIYKELGYLSVGQ